MRLQIFDLIDSEGWLKPADLRIDESPGAVDVIVETDYDFLVN